MTVGGRGAVRVRVLGDKTKGFETSSVLVNATEAEVTWTDQGKSTAGGSLSAYVGGVVALAFELAPGAVLYAHHL